MAGGLRAASVRSFRQGVRDRVGQMRRAPLDLAVQPASHHHRFHVGRAAHRASVALLRRPCFGDIARAGNAALLPRSSRSEPSARRCCGIGPARSLAGRQAAAAARDGEKSAGGFDAHDAAGAPPGTGAAGEAAGGDRGSRRRGRQAAPPPSAGHLPVGHRAARAQAFAGDHGFHRHAVAQSLRRRRRQDHRSAHQDAGVVSGRFRGVVGRRAAAGGFVSAPRDLPVGADRRGRAGSAPQHRCELHHPHDAGLQRSAHERDHRDAGRGFNRTGPRRHGARRRYRGRHQDPFRRQRSGRRRRRARCARRDVPQVLRRAERSVRPVSLGDPARRRGGGRGGPRPVPCRGDGAGSALCLDPGGVPRAGAPDARRGRGVRGRQVAHLQRTRGRIARRCMGSARTRHRSGRRRRDKAAAVARSGRLHAGDHACRRDDLRPGRRSARGARRRDARGDRSRPPDPSRGRGADGRLSGGQVGSSGAARGGGRRRVLRAAARRSGWHDVRDPARRAVPRASGSRIGPSPATAIGRWRRPRAARR